MNKEAGVQTMKQLADGLVKTILQTRMPMGGYQFDAPGDRDIASGLMYELNEYGLTLDDVQLELADNDKWSLSIKPEIRWMLIHVNHRCDKLVKEVLKQVKKYGPWKGEINMYFKTSIPNKSKVIQCTEKNLPRLLRVSLDLPFSVRCTPAEEWQQGFRVLVKLGVDLPVIKQEEMGEGFSIAIEMGNHKSEISLFDILNTGRNMMILIIVFSIYFVLPEQRK